MTIKRNESRKKDDGRSREQASCKSFQLHIQYQQFRKCCHCHSCVFSMINGSYTDPQIFQSWLTLDSKITAYKCFQINLGEMSRNKSNFLKEFGIVVGSMTTLSDSGEDHTSLVYLADKTKTVILTLLGLFSQHLGVSNLFQSVWSEDLRPSLLGLKIKVLQPGLCFILIEGILIERSSCCWQSNVLAVRSQGSLPGGCPLNHDIAKILMFWRGFFPGDAGKMNTFLAQVNPAASL